MKFNTCKTALAAALFGLTGAAHAGVLLNDGIDGAFFDPAAPGRGVMVDYLPNADPDGGTFFGIAFTYDAEGRATWVSFQNETGPVVQGQAEITGMPVRLFSGGSFGNPFSAPTNAAVGTANVRLNSCSNIEIELDMNADSGLSDVAFNYSPLSSFAGVPQSRVCTTLDFAQACPATTTAVGNDCRLPNSIEGNLFLPAGKKYIIEGQVNVVDGGVLTIAPGVTLQGSTNQAQPNFLAVLIGGRIYANGTASAPIVFTGPEPVKASWAGLVIAGRSTCNVATGGQLCAFEAIPSIEYGGTQLDDNSGSLQYVQVLYAGQAVAPDEELNSLTMLGVGSGTFMSHIQVDHGDDDGFEWFGGSVDGKYLVCTNMSDDCFDMDQGYTGRLQFLFSLQGEPGGNFTNDPHGFEIDNNRSAPDTLPRTNPTVSNVTMVGNPAATNGEGMRLRRGTAGTFRGLVLTNYNEQCINIDDAATFAQAGSATAQGPGLTIQNSFVGQCVLGPFDDGASDPFATSAWYNAGNGNQIGDPLLNGILPTAASPFLEGNQVPSDPFFAPVPYKGAFAGPNDRWYAGWTVNIPNN